MEEVDAVLYVLHTLENKEMHIKKSGIITRTSGRSGAFPKKPSHPN